MPSDNLAGSLRPGSRIGPYEIHSLLGAGGMGQVYRARDPHLGRDVAIKLLPEALAVDLERSARFEREARTLAALNHPHIAAIYGVEHLPGRTALVLELVEGETLSQKIAGRLAVIDSLSIASQIADALEAAHEKGIIHRDLKPANVMVQSRRGLQVKVLDFGLAKTDETAGADPDISHSPTVSFAGTKHGVILGTAAYMSPEQARGKPLDKRTDVWSFGCVLYEMLTGRRAFDGETVSDTIAAILGRDPDWSALPNDAPPGVRRLLERCLEKDVTRRLRDIGDVRVNLEHEIAAMSGVGGPFATSSVAPGLRSRLSALWLGVAAAAVVVLAVAVFWLYRRPITPDGPVEPAVQLTDFFDGAVAPSLSPDGRMLTFIRGSDLSFSASAPRGDIYVKMLAGDQAPLQLTHDGTGKEQPVFSPDGSRIVYTGISGGFRWDSWQVGAMGQTAPRLFLQNASGLMWAGERQLLFSEIMQNPHMKIVTSTENRGEQRDIYVPKGEGAMAHRSARSPDGTSVLIAEMDGSGWLPCRVVPFDGSSTGKQVGPLDGQCVTAAWSPDGQWMYFTSNSGGAFHVWRQEYPNGAPEQITFPPTEQEGTTITADGRYLITSQGLQQAAVWLHDDKGDRQLTSEGFAMLPTMSPIGNRVFYLMRGGPQRTYISGELWSMDLTTGEKAPVLPGVSMSGYSITQDGQRVVYTSAGLASGDGIWVASVDRQSRTPPRQLTHGGEYRAFAVASGQIVYMSEGDVRYLYRMKEDGAGVQKISEQGVVFLLSASPDGRWALASMPQETNSDGNQLVFFSTAGDKPYVACNSCSVGFGPGRAQSMITWGTDGRSLFMPLRYYGRQTQRTVALPYDSRVPFERLWPKGLKTEDDVAANPGARLIPEGNAFPASGLTTYFAWRQSTRANIWKVPIPR